MDKREAFRLLGVSENETDYEAIKKQYRQQMLSLHPDRNPGGEEDAKKAAIAVNNAWDWVNAHRETLTVNAPDDLYTASEARFEEFQRMIYERIHEPYWAYIEAAVARKAAPDRGARHHTDAEMEKAWTAYQNAFSDAVDYIAETDGGLHTGTVFRLLGGFNRAAEQAAQRQFNERYPKLARQQEREQNGGWRWWR